MSMFPIAQMAFSLFVPLILLIAAYAALSILAARARAREDQASADRLGTYGFALVLVSAAYVVVLLIATVFSYPSRVYDMVIILFVIAVFFALLLFAFFVIAEILPGTLRRGRNR